MILTITELKVISMLYKERKSYSIETNKFSEETGKLKVIEKVVKIPTFLGATLFKPLLVSESFIAVECGDLFSFDIINLRTFEGLINSTSNNKRELVSISVKNEGILVFGFKYKKDNEVVEETLELTINFFTDVTNLITQDKLRQFFTDVRNKVYTKPRIYEHFR